MGETPSFKPPVSDGISWADVLDLWMQQSGKLKGQRKRICFRKRWVLEQEFKVACSYCRVSVLGALGSTVGMFNILHCTQSKQLKCCV